MTDPVRLTFIGHAMVCIEIAGARFLTDAVVRSQVAFLRWTAHQPRCETLRDVDAILISHLHQDHCDPASLTRLGRDTTVLVPSGAARFLRRRRFTDVVPMQPGSTHTVGAVGVTATKAAHDGWRPPFGPHGQAMGFLLSGAGRRIYFAGDTGLFGGMRDLATELDVALLPVAGWGRRLGPGHLNPVQAAEAVRLLAPAVAVPIHWGALRPFWHRRESSRLAMAPALAFAEEVRRRRLPSAVRIVQPGSSMTWPV